MNATEETRPISQEKPVYETPVLERGAAIFVWAEGAGMGMSQSMGSMGGM